MVMSKGIKIDLAPLQGFTDQAFRSSMVSCMSGIDRFFIPYLSTDHLPLRKNAEFHPENRNDNIETVPQLLPANMDELKTLVSIVERAGYKTVNINAGCPYPMVMNRGRGASLLEKPFLVADFIRYINDYTALEVGVKTRLGIHTEDDILNLLDKFHNVTVSEVILHVRTASQMYKGKVSVKGFDRCRVLFPNFDYVYNGDIFCFHDWEETEKMLLGQSHWMIGRGILQNPFLPWQIKNRSELLPDDFQSALLHFVENWIDRVENESNDHGHALNRVQNQFFYLHHAFPDPQKARRMIRKAKSLAEVRHALGWLL